MWFTIYGAGFRGQGLGFSIQDLAFNVKRRLGFRACDLHPAWTCELRLDDGLLRAPDERAQIRVPYIVNVPQAHAAVRACREHRGVVVRVPHPRRARRHVPAGCRAGSSGNQG